MMSETTQSTMIVLPALWRRSVLLATAFLAGGLAALVLPSPALWGDAAPVIILLALLAGCSALWSP